MLSANKIKVNITIFCIHFPYNIHVFVSVSPLVSLSLSVFWLKIHFLVLLTAVKTQEKYICCSVTQLCQTPCDLMDCSMPGFPILHPFPELA